MTADGNPPDRIICAFVTDSLLPWHSGGKETNIRQISKRMNEHAIDVHLYSMKWWVGPNHHSCDGLPITALCPLIDMYVGERRSIWQAFRFGWATLKLLWVGSFDVILADQVPNLQLFGLWTVARFRRVPLIVIWNEYWGSNYWRRYLGPVFGKLAAGIEFRSSRLPDLIVSISSHTSSRLICSGVPETRVTTIRLPIERATFTDEDHGPTQFDVLYTGRLIAHKRVDLLIEAMALLKKSGHFLRLAIGGDGPERSSLERLSESLSLTDSVTFLGDLGSPEAAQRQMVACRLFVSPSEREGFGLTIAEAIALNVPVVTSDHSDNAAKNLVDRKSGRLFRAGDVADLSRAILEGLLMASEIGEQAGKSPTDVSEYSWDTVVEQYSAVIWGSLRSPRLR